MTRPSEPNGAIQAIAGKELLAKFAAGILVVGLAFQLIQGWASVVGDAIWIVGALIGASQALVTWAANRGSPSQVLRHLWPLGLGWLYIALAFAYWLLLDAGLAPGLSSFGRILLLTPLTLFVIWYLRSRASSSATGQ